MMMMHVYRPHKEWEQFVFASLKYHYLLHNMEKLFFWGFSG